MIPILPLSDVVPTSSRSNCHRADLILFRQRNRIRIDQFGLHREVTEECASCARTDVPIYCRLPLRSCSPRRARSWLFRIVRARKRIRTSASGVVVLWQYALVPEVSRLYLVGFGALPICCDDTRLHGSPSSRRRLRGVGVRHDDRMHSCRRCGDQPCSIQPATE